MINSQAKGKRYELKIAKYINKILGTFLRRTPLSGGMELKGDILEINPESPIYPYHIECKNHKALHIPKWWDQTIRDCPIGKTPVLIFNMKGKDMVCLEINDWLGYLIANDEENQKQQ